AGAYVSIFVGAIMYVYAEATDTSIPAFVIAVSASLVASLIAVYVTKPAPLESYEPYFSAEISDSTAETIEISRNAGK
ncbi:MAG TPA: sodium:solute symporter family protein, partial [Pseudogracilibacillus sp.]|nr:sodium:solute symporter family protein [Pseudogracilibacillus sp.]